MILMPWLIIGAIAAIIAAFVDPGARGLWGFAGALLLACAGAVVGGWFLNTMADPYDVSPGGVAGAALGAALLLTARPALMRRVGTRPRRLA